MTGMRHKYSVIRTQRHSVSVKYRLTMQMCEQGNLRGWFLNIIHNLTVKEYLIFIHSLEKFKGRNISNS